MIQEHFFGCADISILNGDEEDEETSKEEDNEENSITTTVVQSTSIESEETTVTTATYTLSTNKSEENSTAHETSSHGDLAETSSSAETSTASKATTSSNESEEQQIDTEDHLSHLDSQNTYNGCKSKLELGSMSSMSKIVAVYCYRMCEVKCKQIISEVERIKRESLASDQANYEKDLIVCFETCPVLCSC